MEEELFQFVDSIEANLTEEEESEAIKNWLFLTAWLEQATKHEFKDANEVFIYIKNINVALYDAREELNRLKGLQS